MTNRRGRPSTSKISTNPDISVIIPTLNEENFIEASLKSVINQNFDNYEIIIVDGKSKDKTRKIAKGFTDKILISPKRSRQFQCNLGAKNARGDILVFLHADTIMESPDVLKSIFRALKDSKVVAGVCRRKFDNRKLKYIIWEKANVIQMKIMGNICGGSCVPFFRKDIFEKVGGFDENVLMDDVDITRKVKKYGKIKKMNEEVIASARRFEKEGLIRVLLKWFYVSFLLYAGTKINPEYRNIR